MAGLLGLSPSSVSPPPSVAATQTAAPQQTTLPQQPPIDWNAGNYARQYMQNWTPPSQQPMQQTQQQTDPAQPVTATPTPTTSQPTTTSQPDYFTQFFNSLSSIFQPYQQQPVTATPTPTTTVNPSATGLLAPDAMAKPTWIGDDGLTTQPTWAPEPVKPVTQATNSTNLNPTPQTSTPTSPWAAGWDPFAEYDKKNAGYLTTKDPVTGRMYNPWAHPYLKPGQSPFGNINAQGYVTLVGNDEDDFARWQRMQQDGSRGN